MSAKTLFTFADLFAGIGGMRLAFESVGGSCVLTSEINEHALRTYKYQEWRDNNPEHQFINDVVDLGNLSGAKIPKHDVLVAGFPCQPYSIAGLRQGLNDEKGRGQVFLSILDILKKAQPKAFLLENVKGMMSHDDGQTVTFMCNQLRKKGYTIFGPKVLNSMTHGNVPQNRERVFIVGFRDDIAPQTFEFPSEIPLKKSLEKVLEKGKVDQKYFYDKRYGCFDEIKKAVVRSDTAYQWRRVYVRENKSGVCPALTANMGSGGHNVPLVKVADGIRKLTPKECAILQGFPVKKENGKFQFKFPPGMADVHLYHQFGNSVTVPLIERIARRIAEVIVP
jgi:DNA (cytosine-5)-methyltransferase 1